MPFANAVAVLDGRILQVGEIEDLRFISGAQVVDQFAQKVILPGFVEGHAHIAAGSVWRMCYLGFFDREGPNGERWPGLKSLDAVIERLQDAQHLCVEKAEPLLGWGFDPLYFGGIHMTANHLDEVSTTRPVLVLHNTFHALNINSAALHAAGIDRTVTAEGLVSDEAGSPTGEIREFALMQLVMASLNVDLLFADPTETDIWDYASVARRAGVTTACDMANLLSGETLRILQRVTTSDAFPLRLVPLFLGRPGDPAPQLKRIAEAIGYGNEKLHLGRVKLITDGAITAFTARIKKPGYFNGAPNGLWNMPPAELYSKVRAFHDAGYQIHVHVNGDEASELALEVFEKVQRESPQTRLKHTFQHCQMMDVSQFRRLACLGISANLFTNHIYYYGDVHYETTLGSHRAGCLNAAASALKAGVTISIHSDAPVTPLAPLFTAWVSINRTTSSGRLLGSEERLSLDEALYAITMGAARSLQLDDQIGSISPGKHADFAILDDDPYSVLPEFLKDIAVSGTVVGGVYFPKKRQSES
ncbi:amidohydrolase [Caballeronia sordidicola]|nr:amidohydrolase [Caballeronia sordidicola]